MKLSLFWGFLTFFPFFISGQSITSDTISLEEVVVTGSKVEVSRKNLPVTVTVVTRKELEESAESALLPALSEQIPGLFITERGITGFGVSSGSAGQINLRGLGGNPTTQVLILIDGHPQFMGLMGHPIPDSYVSGDVQKVEVVKGPASILYGSNAMGGAINLITRRQTAPPAPSRTGSRTRSRRRRPPARVRGCGTHRLTSPSPWSSPIRPPPLPVSATTLIRGMFQPPGALPMPGLGTLPADWLDLPLLAAALHKVSRGAAFADCSLRYGEPAGDARLPCRLHAVARHLPGGDGHAIIAA